MAGSASAAPRPPAGGTEPRASGALGTPPLDDFGPLDSIESALAHLRQGRPVIVADDEDRENEGDVILSGELASQQWMAWLVRVSSGLVCAPVSAEIADRLDLPPMVARNEDARGTAYTVTVDAARGVTTGISAHDRAHTLNVLASPDSVRDDLHRPGHILPLRAVAGGVRVRAGHTEAGVDLMLAAGLRPVAAISEIVADDGEMMRLPGLRELGAREGVPVITIAQFVEWLDERDTPNPVEAIPLESTTAPAGTPTPAPLAAGTTPAPLAAGTTPAPLAAGTTPAPPVAGTTPAPAAEGVTA